MGQKEKIQQKKPDDEKEMRTQKRTENASKNEQFPRPPQKNDENDAANQVKPIALKNNPQQISGRRQWQ